MDTPDKCPVCLDGGPDKPRARNKPPTPIRHANGRIYIDCDVCGRYSIPDELWEDALDPQSNAGKKLSGVCRARLSHKLTTGAISDTSERIFLTEEFLERFVRDGCPGPTPSEQATNIVRFIGDDVSSSGKLIDNFPKGFYATIGAPTQEFADELVTELIAMGIVSGNATDTMGDRLFFGISLTLHGWEKYEAEKRGLVAGNYGFIAMKFGDVALDPFIEKFVKPAVKESIGFDLIDLRDVSRAGVIDNIMRAQIRDAAFVLVDLTHDNSGAYWEAGYAEGLGKPVVYMCEKSKFDQAKTHFDTNHCTTVLWSEETSDRFQRELIATLRRSLNLFPVA